jgi:hypothetical protein
MQYHQYLCSFFAPLLTAAVVGGELSDGMFAPIPVPALPRPLAPRAPIIHPPSANIIPSPTTGPQDLLAQTTAGDHLVCETEELLFEVLVFTDNNPGETSWILRSFDGSHVHSSTEFTMPLHPYKFSDCLSVTDHFQFVIMDSKHNGLTDGDGFYVVSVNGKEIHKGGEFTYAEDTYLEPTCGKGMARFSMDLRTDYFGNETSWSLQAIGANAPILGVSGGPYKPESRYLIADCISLNACWKLTVSDRNGDGLCCDYGQGSYILEYNGRVVMESKFESGFDEITTFGLTCQEPEGTMKLDRKGVGVGMTQKEKQEIFSVKERNPGGMKIPFIEAIGTFSENLHACWDLGHVDQVQSTKQCEMLCGLTPHCMSFSYHPDDGNKRCNICSEESPHTTVECSNIQPCSEWGIVDESLSPTSIRDKAIQVAQGVCTGKNTPEMNLEAATYLNVIAKNIHAGVYTNSGAPDFTMTHASALKEADKVLEFEDMSCFGTITSNSCTFGGILFLQLRALLALAGESGERVFPQSRDLGRRQALDEQKVLVADNGWFDDLTLMTMLDFLETLRKNSLTGWSPFLRLSVSSNYMCMENEHATTLLSFTDHDVAIFPIQTGTRNEQGFPDDTPSIPEGADGFLFNLRHELARRFSKRIDNDKRLLNMFHKLLTTSTYDDLNYLESDVGADYFDSQPQDIVPAQLGNQYMQSSSAQLRLGGSRFDRTKVPMGWFLLNLDILNEDNKAIFFESNADGESIALCVRLGRDAQGRISDVKIPGCRPLVITYDANSLPATVSKLDDILTCQAHPEAKPVC